MATALPPGDAPASVSAGATGVAGTPRLRSAAFGAACISLQPVLLSTLMLPATAYVIRGLGPTAYGQWATATALAGAMSFLTSLGLRGTFVRAVARDPESAPNALAEQLGVRAVLSFVAAGVALAVCLALGYPRVVILCTALSVLSLVLGTVATTAADLLQALHRLPTVALVNGIAGLVLTCASVAAVFAGTGPVGVAASYMLGAALSALLFVRIIHRRHFRTRVRWNLRRSVSLLWEARHFAAQQLIASLSSNAESLIVPRLVGSTTFGFFSAGILPASRLAAVPEGIGAAAYPAIARAHRVSFQASLRVSGRFLALMMLVCIGATVTVMLLAHPIAQILFPGRSDLCEQVMRITIWLLPLIGVNCIAGYALNAVGEDAAHARASLVGAGCSVLVTVFLISQFGLIGACWSAIARQALNIMALLPTLSRVFRSWRNEQNVAPLPVQGLA